MPAYKNYVVYLMPFIVVMVALMIVISEKSTPSVSSARPGRALPMFYLPNLFEPAKGVTRDDVLGKVSIINIWASWCDACVNEHGLLMTLRDHDAIAIYGVNFKDDPANAKKWLHFLGNPYTEVGIDATGSFTHSLGVSFIPETFLIDPWGRVRYTHTGILTQNIIDSEILPRIKKYTEEFAAASL